MLPDEIFQRTEQLLLAPRVLSHDRKQDFRSGNLLSENLCGYRDFCRQSMVMCLFFLIGLFIASIAATALLLFYLHLSTEFMIMIIELLYLL